MTDAPITTPKLSSPVTELADWLEHYTTCFVHDDLAGRTMLEIIAVLRAPAPATALRRIEQDLRRTYAAGLPDGAQSSLNAAEDAIKRQQGIKPDADVLASDLVAAGECEYAQCAPDALGYATRLLEHFVAEHFPHNPDWSPLPDLIGVLTQLDNAITIARDYKERLRAYEGGSAFSSTDSRMVECNGCGGSGFEGSGTGYGDVCSECGGQRVLDKIAAEAGLG